MDQTILLYAQMMEYFLKFLLPSISIIATVALYLHQNGKSNLKEKADYKVVEAKFKDIEHEMDKKVDLTAYKTKMQSIDTEINTLKTTASEDRAIFLAVASKDREIFLGEVRELRKDLRLKKDINN